MTDVVQKLREGAAKAVKALYDLDLAPETLQIQPTSKEHEGDFTLVIFPLLRHKIGKPQDVGEAVGKWLMEQQPAPLSGFELIKGFLNIKLAPKFWLDFLSDVNAQGESYFRLKQDEPEKVMIEYPSPNTNKPLHLGHLRNLFLGESVASILEAAGHEVFRVCLYNDKGIHICKSMLAYQKFGKGETPETSGIKGDHLIGKYYVEFAGKLRDQIEPMLAEGADPDEAERQAALALEAQAMYRKWEAGDPEVVALWEKMNGWVYEGFEKTYARLGIHFDKNYHESETYLLGKELVQEGLDKGVFQKQDDGSVWIDLTDAKLDKKLLLRSDGTSLYITQDLGTAELKYEEFGIDRSVYVIGNEQDYHMRVLAETLRRLGKPYADGIYHLSYGMVELTTGKMKSREGTVVDADDLLDDLRETARRLTEELGKTEGLEKDSLEELYEMLGQGALKYYLLKVDPVKRMVFNPEESIDFKGDTGTFVQFTCARINSILRKARKDELTWSDLDDAYAPGEAETAALQLLQQYPKALADAAESFAPSIIAGYMYDLARAYSRFYHENPVLTAEDPAALKFRLALCEATARAVTETGRLLGIKMPERM